MREDRSYVIYGESQTGNKGQSSQPTSNTKIFALSGNLNPNNLNFVCKNLGRVVWYGSFAGSIFSVIWVGFSLELWN